MRYPYPNFCLCAFFSALYGRGFKTGALYSGGLLGGSWVVISQVFSPNMGYKLLE